MTPVRIICIAVAALALSAPAAHAACGGVVSSKPTRDRLPGKVRAPLAIGDSVMLGAVDEMAGAGFEVNVRGCRQMSEGLDLMRARKRAGTLPRAVLVLLGANWTISQDEIREATRILGPERVLVMLTPTESGGGAGSDAYNVRQAGRRWPESVVVLDWVAYSAGHSELVRWGRASSRRGRAPRAWRASRRGCCTWRSRRGRPSGPSRRRSRGSENSVPLQGADDDRGGDLRALRREVNPVLLPRDDRVPAVADGAVETAVGGEGSPQVDEPHLLLE